MSRFGARTDGTGHGAWKHHLKVRLERTVTVTSHRAIATAIG